MGGEVCKTSEPLNRCYTSEYLEDLIFSAMMLEEQKIKVGWSKLEFSKVRGGFDSIFRGFRGSAFVIVIF